MDEYILTYCSNCGNEGLKKKVANYNQQLFDYCDGEPFAALNYDWYLLECPVCKSISLFRRFGSDYMIDNSGDEYYEEKIVFPTRRTFSHVPENIMKSYEVAIRTAKIDMSVSLIAIRSVLEKICKERGTNRKNLNSMLKEMVEKNIFPETLDKCGFIIRKMGNSGAHDNDHSQLTKLDIEQLIDFIETIMYYIYELPVKVNKLNKKYDLNIEGNEDSGATI